MALVSVSAYARLHGVTKGAAQKWQARGLLKFIDGKVETEASDRSLLHAGLGRFAPGGMGSRSEAATGRRVAAEEVADTQAIAGELLSAAEDHGEIPPALIAFANGLASGDVVNLIEAQTYKENGLALLRILDARKRANELVEMADAEAVLFEMFRLQRDAWLNFPSRSGPIIAADLGLDPDRVVEVLTSHVHQHLADLGEPDNPLREAGAPEGDSPESMDAAA